MDGFPYALKFVLLAEGGYSNTPGDKGGATNFGITQGTYDSWTSSKGMPRKPVSSISHDEAEQIYRSMYWATSACNQLPLRLAVIQFDTAVNCGPRTAVKLLQTSLDVSDDGKFGPATLNAVNNADEDSVIHEYLNNRDDHYRWIVDNDPSQAKFLKGWLNRVAALGDYLEGLRNVELGEERSN